ncbi:ATP-binding protein [Elusimicrobiota bacterium]
MKRDIYKELIEWKNTSEHKPLILGGARQVGKTYILKEFGKNEFDNLAYFNFEENPELINFFEDTLNAQRIIEKLSLYQEKKIDIKNTLIFFDEIQEAPRALTSLKYFAESDEHFNIVSAGSLLGIKLRQSSPFPVGKVTELNLFPFSFGEFLDGIGKNQLRYFLNDISGLNPIDEVFHKQLLELLRMYFYIGGMPAAIKQYNLDGDLNKVRKIQDGLLSGYEKDFSKHASESTAIKLTRIWRTLPIQLAKENKKFKFSEIEKSARAREYNEVITWLEDAGMVYKSYNIQTPKLPLAGYREENIFKLFLLDVGLLGAMLKLSSKTVTEGNVLFREYNGAFTENYVAQELTASGYSDIYYWTSQRSAEVDFVIADEEHIYPLEVKSGTSLQNKSLVIYGQKYSDSILSRATIKNFKHDGNIYNYPLYSISHFPKLS